MTAILALWPLAKRFAPLALIAALVLWAMIERGNARHWHKAYDGEHAAHQLDIESWKRATAEATARALAEKAATEARQTAIKEQADETLTDARDDAQRAVAEYVRLHRPTSADRSNASGTNLSAATANSEQPQGQGGETVVPAADLNICAIAVTRLENAVGWAAQLEGR